jgi:hypothetical protein
MKNIFLTLIYFMVQMCTPAFAADRIVDGTIFPGIDHQKNFVINSDAEKNKNNIVDASTIVTRSLVAPLQGVASFSIDASASGQLVKFNTNTLDQYLKGLNCEAKFVFTGDASLYKAYVEQGATKVTPDLQLTSESNSKNVSINFQCGDLSSNSRLVLESTGAGAAAIKVDKVFLGAASNLSQVSQAQLIGTLDYAPNANCRWQLSTGSFSDYPADTDCLAPTVTGQVSAPGTKIPGFVLNNIGAGTIKIVATGHFRHLNSAGNWPAFRFSDGTNFTSSQGMEASTAGGSTSTMPVIEGQLTYSSPQSNLTIQIQQGANGGTQDTEIYAESNANLHFDVYYFPSQEQSVANVTQSQSIYSADLSFAAATSNATVFADINVTTPGIGTVYLNQNNGTIAAYASGLGLTVTPKQLGVYEACFDISFTHNTSAQNNSFVIYNGATVIGSTVTAQVNSGTDIKTVKPCGQFTATSLAPVDIHVMYATSAGTMTLVSAGVSLKSISSAVNAPVLVGAVKSQSSSEENIFRIKVAGDVAQTTNCTTGTCATVDTNSGGSNVTYAGPGVYDINFASGLFSAAPSCTCVCGTIGVGPKLCYVDHTTATASLAQASCYTPATMTAVDGIVTVTCVGPK